MGLNSILGPCWKNNNQENAYHFFGRVIVKGIIHFSPWDLSGVKLKPIPLGYRIFTFCLLLFDLKNCPLNATRYTLPYVNLGNLTLSPTHKNEGQVGASIVFSVIMKVFS